MFSYLSTHLHVIVPVYCAVDMYNVHTYIFVIVSVLKKKSNHDPILQYRKAKEPTVKLNGLVKTVLTRRY